ncbi:hypothetical protein [Actinocatenispora rupis]|uniref:Glycosyl hydrolase catalytic core n=1 Tax=Actinocatenispora rupis TaxID=519421 RepID=A0A8J3JFG3_9ACTN|nr:hypothetical protein [Actinocatenispora rupis]GID15462.1 hypothetical protein Aru02nite_63510 [Actinocatenispora rupis]
MTGPTSRRTLLRTVGAAAVALPVLAGGVGRPAAARAQRTYEEGGAAAAGTFARFVGTCQGSDTTTGVPTIGGMAWDRTDVFWSAAQPTDAPIGQEYLDALTKKWTDAAAAGVTVLPILDSTAPWAVRTDPYTFEFGPNTYAVGPVLSSTDDALHRLVTVTDTATGTPVSSTEEDISRSSTPPRSVDEWTAYVDAIVGALHSVGVRYFQVWNEAWLGGGFWYGGLKDYLDTVHRPAARVIRSYDGAKVVYGGWAAIGGVDNYIATLDRYDAWGDVDVFDMHYYQPKDMETLHAAAPAEYPDPPIWQTEIGWTSDTSLVSRSYPRVFRWALDHGLATDPDHHKLFWFAWAGTPENCLWGGSAPTAHGASVQTLSGLLPGTDVTPFTAFRTDPVLPFDLATDQSSAEGFAVGDTAVVLALHVAHGAAPSSVTVTFDSVPSGATVRRVSILGAGTDLDWTSPGVVSVPLADGDSDSAAINAAAPTTTCYVRVAW